MLGAETAAELAHDVVNRALDRRLPGEEYVAGSPRGLVEIEVQIAVAYMSVRDEPSIRDILRDPLRGAFDKPRQRGDGDRDIVLQTGPVNTLRLGNRLAHLPHRCAFTFAARERSIQYQTILESTGERSFEHRIEGFCCAR